MSSLPRLDPRTARHELTDHPYYRYRGCAPDVDDPRMAAGNPSLPVTSWEPPDVDGGEPQDVRIARETAAIDVCVSCPVMVQCLAYGSSVTEGGKLAEPYAILGGMTALERHRQFVKARTREAKPKPVLVQQLQTRQKLAVLRALARYTGAEAVATAAGMDVRTANWQRSIIVGMVGLDRRSATRMQLLDVVRGLGLLDDVTVVADDGSVTAVPPPGKSATTGRGPRQQVLTALPAPAPELVYDAPRRPRVRGRAGGRGRSTAVPGQLPLALDFDDLANPAAVAQLPTRSSALLEAAA